MNPEAAEQERLVLRLLEKTEGPVGAGTVREYLEARGFSASEATVGRLLRDMDRRGLTARMGFQGRILTDLGSIRLTELSEARQQEASAVTLLERIYSGDDDAAFELLVARNAVESRIARLAAGDKARGSGEELSAAIEEWRKPRCDGTGAMDSYRLFFEALARLGGNGILSAIDGILLGKDGGVLISPGIVGAVTKDFESLAKAVLRKDPDAAEKAVQNHIDRLVKRRRKSKA